MDSGCVDPGEEFDETYDVSRSLAPEEVVGIIDQLICHEVSHLDSLSLQHLLTLSDGMASWLSLVTNRAHERLC